MNVTDFEQRRNEILEAIIEAYVSTASPVGSALISRRLRQSLSPATVRNVMAELEDDGLLEQPHTSAGRVPTDRGYRYYVDSLMETVRLSQEESRRLSQTIQPEEPDLDQLLARANEVLSQSSHQTTFVVAPTVKHTTIKQIELLPLSLHKLLCVLVGQEAVVASHVVEVEEPISRDEAVSLARFLNTELSGLPALELLTSLERRLLAASDTFYHLVRRSLSILQTALATEPEERLLLDGTTYLFEQPEFRKDPQRTHELLRQLELQEELLERLRADLSQPGTLSEGVRIRIGREVDVEGLEECSYLVAPVSFNQAVVGGMGILGPKRMDYRRMRALVEGVARLVTEAMSQWQSD